MTHSRKIITFSQRSSPSSHRSVRPMGEAPPLMRGGKTLLERYNNFSFFITCGFHMCCEDLLYVTDL